MLATGEPRRAPVSSASACARSSRRCRPRGPGVRGRGLWAGIDIDGRTGRDVCEGLMRRGVLAKDTHGSTIRLAPPLVIERADLEWAVDQLRQELEA